MEKRGALIGFVCVAPEHLGRNGAADHITIFEKEWAFCAANARGDGHQWKPTGGASLLELEAMVRASRESTHQPRT
jgi:hypothetical protein